MRSMDRSTAAEAIVRAGARLGRRGLIAAGEGNLSCRLDDGSILVTPSGYRKDELTVDDLVVVDPAGVVARDGGPNPTSDLAIHLAVYEARPDVRAVAHAHLPASMGLTLAGSGRTPRALPKPPPCSARPVRAVRRDGQRRAWRAGSPPPVEEPGAAPVAVILERHGAVAVGDEPDTAVDRLELVEVLCRAWRDALLVRAARAILAGRLAPAASRPGQPGPLPRRRCPAAVGLGAAGAVSSTEAAVRPRPASTRSSALAHVDERWFLDPAAVERARTPRLNRQPAGMCAASGVSPTRIVRRARSPGVGGSGVGETETSARVYGFCGLRMTRSAGPISMILPRYITAIRSAMTHASDRSWVMNR